MDELHLETLRDLFKPFDIRYDPEKHHLDYPPGLLNKASVLIPLFYHDGDYRVILTSRSKNLTHDAGYVAFPGGKKDDNDQDEIETALREAKEEIGLDPKLVEIICIGSPGIAQPNMLTYPVIALLRPDFKLKWNFKEVSLVFDLPLSRFLTTERLRIFRFAWQSAVVFHIHHFTDLINGQEVRTSGLTSTFCISTALVLYQSDKIYCLNGDEETTKDQVFNFDFTRKVVSTYQKGKAKI